VAREVSEMLAIRTAEDDATQRGLELREVAIQGAHGVPDRNAALADDTNVLDELCRVVTVHQLLLSSARSDLTAGPRSDPEETPTARMALSLFKQDRHRPHVRTSRRCASSALIAPSTGSRSKPVLLMMHSTHMASTRMRATAPLSRLGSRRLGIGLPFSGEWPHPPQHLDDVVIQGEDERQRSKTTKPPTTALAVCI
jgi:hypothetical protein